MLRSLNIRDFVIVDELDLDLDHGFTVLTGETGAGKSILLDALSLVLGERADPSQIREGKNKAEISALFSLDGSLKEFISNWLDEQGFNIEDDGSTLILKRIIDSSGRSRAFINGSIATLNQTKELGNHLVDIHGQHAHQLLLKTGAQRDLLDHQAQLQEQVLTVKGLYQEWQAAKKQLELAKSAGESLQKEQERLSWQLEELDQLAPKAGEWAEIDVEYSRLANAAKLIEGSQNALAMLSEQEGNAEELLGKAFTEIEDLAKLDSHLEDAKISLESAQIQISEATHSLNRYLQKIDVDPDRLAEVEERLKALHSAAKKFKVTPEELPTIWLDIKEKVNAIKDSQDLAALEKNLLTTQAEYNKAAKSLSQNRNKAAKILEKLVTEAMQDLSMAGGQFVIGIEPLAEGNAYGLENIEFLVAGHPGVSPKPLSKVASGGELARISLAISVITSEASQIPTLIFDEVDSGIGGAVAETVGKRLKELGQAHQVLCVTHLAQVAAQGHQHWKVEKQSSDNSTTSSITSLNRQERVEEIARMLGGTEITDTTRRHARELLGQ
ncbi:DNA repair protein RecN [Polynucleobacter victoriensis]|uniref:DNA repair protein RecN n=1 Tax=Polynucleobacter victoriensis TaxID=2049319 RepID=A0A212TGI5_9BURK|nr:DNA repair protein RecN [Polynucleobacter victoriensis]SNC64941.1 DNA repair protein RecN (Recombination protein N) [Polynucleobacter victoriensis]